MTLCVPLLTAEKDKLDNDGEPLYYSNFDLETIVTPVKVQTLIDHLWEVNYKLEEIELLENGFTNGFNIGYEGPQERQSFSENIPLTMGSNVELWNKLMKEVKLKHVASSYDTIPFSNFIQSPIGLVPKAGSEQTRLIFHLSYDFKDKNNPKNSLGSVNHYTPKEKCSVKYRDLEFAVRTYLQLYEEMNDNKGDTDSIHRTYSDSHKDLSSKWNTKFSNHLWKGETIVAAKSDLKSAFRILGLSKESWKWLVMKAQDPSMGEWKYFVDKCLPFGSSISCAHFQWFSDTLCFLIKYRLQVKKRVTNYLDNFLFIARTLAYCNFIVN